MSAFRLKFGLGIAVLMVVFSASQLMYWRSVAALHDYLAGAILFTEDLHDAEAFHSSAHNMLISARLAVHDKEGFYEDQFKTYKRNAEESLQRIAQRNAASNKADIYKSQEYRLATSELLGGMIPLFAGFQETLEGVFDERVENPASALNRAKGIFDDIFMNYYLRLHDHFAMQVSRLTESGQRIKMVTDILFVAQLAVALLAGAVILLYFEKVILRLHAAADRHAYTDSLTSLYNRRHLTQCLHEEIYRAERYNKHFSIAMIDIDDFKKYNDTFGHQAGDRLLTGVADIMRSSVRKTDVAVRYGGEEFLVLLPETGRRPAAVVAEKIRSAVASQDFHLPKGHSSSVTVSIGVAVFPEDGTTVDEILTKVDDMLYSAKREGKNRVKT